MHDDKLVACGLWHPVNCRPDVWPPNDSLRTPDALESEPQCARHRTKDRPQLTPTACENIQRAVMLGHAGLPDLPGKIMRTCTHVLSAPHLLRCNSTQSRPLDYRMPLQGKAPQGRMRCPSCQRVACGCARWVRRRRSRRSSGLGSVWHTGNLSTGNSWSTVWVKGLGCRVQQQAQHLPARRLSATI